MSQKSKVCKFFVEGRCKFTDEECRFLHVKESTPSVPAPPVPTVLATVNSNNPSTSTKPSRSDPTRNLAKQIHYQPSSKKKKEDEYGGSHGKKKNTETFEPYYGPSDLRVVVEISKDKKKTKLELQTNDVAVIPDLFDDPNIHDKLLKEMDHCGIDSENLWKLWHGDSHLIADDSTHFKEKCPTFLKVLDRIRDYFDMDIKATRFNLYRDDKDHKPFHFDASAIKPEKAKIQNITVGVSFGRTREIAFEDALEPRGHRRIISFPMPNGSIYAFCKDINTNWRHGVPAIPENQIRNESRISIIAWGWVNQKNLN